MGMEREEKNRSFTGKIHQMDDRSRLENARVYDKRRINERKVEDEGGGKSVEF